MTDGNSIKGQDAPIPFPQKLDIIEKWISDYKLGDTDRLGAIETPEQCALLLNGVIEGLSKRKRARVNNVGKDRAIGLMRELISLSSETTESRIGFSQKALDRVSNYKFSEIETAEQGYEYANNNSESLRWNSMKFKKFMNHIIELNGNANKKAEIFILLFDKQAIDSCDWSNNMYKLFAKLVNEITDSEMKLRLIMLFNHLPRVQKHRKRGDSYNDNDPWNVLYFKSKLSGYDGSRGFTSSPIGNMPEKMGTARRAAT